MRSTRPFSIILLLSTFLLPFALEACGETPASTPQPSSTRTSSPSPVTTKVAMANPGSLHCLEQGGQLAIREGQDGQYGVCLFSDGSECEEWDFFKGYCQPGQPGEAAEPGQPRVRDAKTPTEEPGTQENETSPTETSLPSLPIASPSAEPFIPSGLAAITPENINRLEIVANLEVPGVYWTVFSPDSQHLATIYQEAQDRSWQIEAWDLNQGTSMYTVPGGPTAFFSGNGELAAMVTSRGFTIFEGELGNVRQELNYPGAIALSPDLSYVVTSHLADELPDTAIITVIDSRSGSAVHKFSVEGTIVAALYSPDGDLLAITTGGITSETTLWNMQTGELLATIDEVDRLTFSPDGDQFAGLFGPMKEIRILGSFGFIPRITLDNGAGLQAQELAFSSDGGLLAAGLGNKVRIWDTQSGQEATTLEVQASNIAFSPNDALFLTSNFQGEVRLWAVVP